MENTALKGFLSSESDDEVRVDVSGGTWIVRRADIEQQLDWTEPAPTFHAEGKPVKVVIRAGAQVGFLRFVTVEPIERPITLPARYSKVAGTESISDSTEEWGRSHGFQLDVKVAAANGHTSVSCWDDPSGFGAVCQGDDCM
jgi:hypothetical protein